MNESRSKQTPSSSVELVSGAVQRASIGVRRVSSRVQRASIGVRRVSSRVQRASVGGRRVSSRVQRVSVGGHRVSSRVQRVSRSVGGVSSAPFCGIYSVSTPSRLFFHVSTESERTANHALQRTVPRVTVAAISSLDPSRPSGALSYARCRFLRPTTQLPRRAPRSLSLGSLGVRSRLLLTETV